MIDLCPRKARGVYRNAWSLHANTGNVCLPVSAEELEAFSPEDATIEAVLNRLPAPATD